MKRKGRDKNMENKGEHVVCDAYLSGFPNEKELVNLAEQSLAASNMHIVDKLIHKFNPQGMTLVWVLAESHFIIHTYPEHEYMSIDCYTCGNEGKPLETVKAFLSNFEIKQKAGLKIMRGGNTKYEILK